MNVDIKIVGYGKNQGQVRAGVLVEVTHRVIWLKSDGGKEDFRIRDGKRVGDSTTGWKIHQDNLKHIPGRNNGR